MNCLLANKMKCAPSKKSLGKISYPLVLVAFLRVSRKSASGMRSRNVSKLAQSGNISRSLRSRFLSKKRYDP